MRLALPLIPILALALIADVGAGPKKKKDPVQTKEKVTSSGKFVAKLTALDPTAKSFTVQITLDVVDPQKVLQNAQYDAQRRLEIARQTSPIERAKQWGSHLVTMRQKNAQIYTRVTKDVKLRAADDLKVRIMHLPIDYDEKGRIRRYTAKERAALKGPNKSLPGYTAEFDNLSGGQTVMVYLAKQKKPKSKTKKKGTGSKDSDDGFFEQLPKVNIMLILDEPKAEK